MQLNIADEMPVETTAVIFEGMPHILLGRETIFNDLKGCNYEVESEALYMTFGIWPQVRIRAESIPTPYVKKTDVKKIEIVNIDDTGAASPSSSATVFSKLSTLLCAEGLNNLDQVGALAEGSELEDSDEDSDEQHDGKEDEDFEDNPMPILEMEILLTGRRLVCSALIDSGASINLISESVVSANLSLLMR